MSDTKYTKQNILEASVPEYLRRRIPTGIPFMDTVLGGGFVPSITYMLSGDPGAGKTTLMIQAADGLTKHGNIVLFNSVEQTKDQVVDLADRIGLKHGFVFENHKDYKEVMLHAQFLRRENPKAEVVVVVDSLSAMANGSRAKAQEIGDAFIAFCQITKMPGVFLVHTTKNGQFAGNNAMKHAFDAHFHLTVVDPDHDDGARILNTRKNRFAKKVSEEMMLTDHGHVPISEVTADMMPMPMLLGDDDFELVEQ